jgi:hypothetical protein
MIVPRFSGHGSNYGRPKNKDQGKKGLWSCFQSKNNMEHCKKDKRLKSETIRQDREKKSESQHQYLL